MKKTIFFLLFIAIGMTSCNTTSIQSTEEVQEFIIGKWHDETVESGGVITYYRFEITAQEIKCWKQIAFLDGTGTGLKGDDKWEEQTPVALSIGNVQAEPANNQSYEKKYRTLGDCSYGTYTFEHNSKFGNSLNFKDNNSVNSDTECVLEKGWEY
ncbi:hypothetical protein [Flavobacterium pectinovorum]|uniref:Uncharacterized protein n=1 Tax=Flavobacterium pectinovorum TaxID=29533 RepID=A0A502E3S8_9FLAO|nr:hypothetical protein [Flavobacterium pectinovorum]TPG31090.1 hypothetical protein EAH81_27120 [Flavobacterium pectinovorum]